MTPCIHARLYDRVSDLFPALSELPVGSAYFAAPRAPDDLAIYCTVTNSHDGVLQLELVHDYVNDAWELSAPWIVLSVDTNVKTASVVSVYDSLNFQASKDGSRPTYVASATLFAINWLSILGHLHTSLTPVTAPCSVAS